MLTGQISYVRVGENLKLCLCENHPQVSVKKQKVGHYDSVCYLHLHVCILQRLLSKTTYTAFKFKPMIECHALLFELKKCNLNCIEMLKYLANFCTLQSIQQANTYLCEKQYITQIVRVQGTKALRQLKSISYIFSISELL